jgi:hypothetical protein
MDDVFLALSNAYDLREKASKAVEEARLNSHINIHVARFDAQQRESGFENERDYMSDQITELKDKIEEIHRSIEALDIVRSQSNAETWQAIDKIRLESHNKIHEACLDVQRADTAVDEALYEFNTQFEKESARLDAIVTSMTDAQSKAEVKVTATKLAFDAACKEYEDAKFHFQCVKEAHDAAVNARSVLDKVADEADALK